MKLPQLKTFKWNYLVLAFAFPFVGMLVLMICAGCTPFGNSSMLYSDCWHQYYPFFKNFREALLSGDSLLYNWDIGMGLDYLGLISYYLASPLNLLSILVPEEFTLPFFSLMTPVRLGLAGLFFAIFLKKLFNKDDLSLPLFGSFYALCAWALGYQWNVMWLDTFALLPLVALGTVQLLRDKKVILYTVTLFLSVFVNYYIGFFVCIFVLLLFICYQICRCESVKGFFADLCRIALFTVLAIGMTAILELPALAALQTTHSSVNNFPTGFDLNITDEDTWQGLLDAMRQVAGNMSGGLEPNFKDGKLPNLYCGVGTVVLALLFLTSREVKLRDKICSVVLLLFLIVSFIFRQLDYIWHGFHFTNQIPYRFSFIYSFIMLYMAYRAYLLRDRFKVWQVVAAALLTLGIILCSNAAEDIPEAMSHLGEFFGALVDTMSCTIESAFQPDNPTVGQRLNAAISRLDSLSDNYGSAYIFIVFNGIFFAMYVGILIIASWDKKLPKDAKKAVIMEYRANRAARQNSATVLLAAVMAAELVLNIVNFGVNFTYTNIANYPRGTEYTASMINYMKEREEGNLFYRAEMTHARPLNEGALNSFSGISTFTSSANVKVTEFMKDLGFGAKNNYNRYLYEESSPVANLFLNLKYLIERDGPQNPEDFNRDNAYFDTVHHYGTVYLMENNAYLPLGFLAESELAELDFSTSDTGTIFNFQNALFSAATGITDDVWHINTGTQLTVTPSQKVELTSQTANGYCYYNSTGSGDIVYTYTALESGLLCLDINMSARNTYNLYKKGENKDDFLYNESISLPQTMSVCDVEPGDVVTVKITCKSNEKGSINIKAGVLNEEVFRRGYDVLAASTLELTEFSNTYVEGTVNCNRDGLLYTSIPQNGTNWSVKVDGEDAEITLIGDAMIAVALTEGEHTVSFSYHNTAFTAGCIVSLVCLAAFGAIVYFTHYSKNPRKKEQSEE